MELAQNIRVVEPTSEIASATSPPGKIAFSEKKNTRLHCVIERSAWQTLPVLDDVVSGIDSRSGSDVILIPGDPEVSAAKRLVFEASGPAPVIISQSQTIGPRADLILSDWSAPSLSAAIRSPASVIARVSELPRLPSGVDSDGLSALALAHTRNCSIVPMLRPDEPTVAVYPLLYGNNDPRAMLEELAAAGMLRRRFFERLRVCQRCGSSRLYAHEVCIKCYSSHLVEHSLVHHYACGRQTPQPMFEVGSAYICPKCRKELRPYGVDYDKPGSAVSCQCCGSAVSEPEVGFLCLDCPRTASEDHAGFRDWYQYDLLPSGVAALKNGRLPVEDCTTMG